MRIESQELLNEFIKKNPELIGDLTDEQVKDITYGPYRFLKKEMESGELPEVRIKYIGSFQVYEGRARNMLYNLKQRFKFHKIDPKQYFSLKAMIEKYLKKLEDDRRTS